MMDHKRDLAEWCWQHQLPPPLYDREAVGPSTQVLIINTLINALIAIFTNTLINTVITISINTIIATLITTLTATNTVLLFSQPGGRHKLHVLPG